MKITDTIEQKYNFSFSSFKTILVVALVFRLLSAFFSQGYGMHDDHFVVIEKRLIGFFPVLRCHLVE